MRIGVLALQGAFAEHEKMLSMLGAEAFEIRKRASLPDSFDGLIIPGGESTVQGKLLRELDLLSPIKSMISSGLPVFGTWAGLILLAKKTGDGAVYLCSCGGEPSEKCVASSCGGISDDRFGIRELIWLSGIAADCYLIYFSLFGEVFFYDLKSVSGKIPTQKFGFCHRLKHEAHVRVLHLRLCADYRCDKLSTHAGYHDIAGIYNADRRKPVGKNGFYPVGKSCRRDIPFSRGKRSFRYVAGICGSGAFFVHKEDREICVVGADIIKRHAVSYRA